MNIGDYVCVSIPFLKKKIFGVTVKIPNFMGLMIRLATFSRYDHCFIYIGNNKIVEAQPSGAIISDISKYNGYKMLQGTTNLTTTQRKQIIKNTMKLNVQTLSYLSAPQRQPHTKSPPCPSGTT